MGVLAVPTYQIRVISAFTTDARPSLSLQNFRRPAAPQFASSLEARTAVLLRRNSLFRGGGHRLKKLPRLRVGKAGTGAVASGSESPYAHAT